MSRFPEDYPTEALRGVNKPSRARIRQVMEARCAWLEKKIAEYNAQGRKPGLVAYQRDELAAVHILIKMADLHWKELDLNNGQWKE